MAFTSVCEGGVALLLKTCRSMAKAIREFLQKLPDPLLKTSRSVGKNSTEFFYPKRLVVCVPSDGLKKERGGMPEKGVKQMMFSLPFT